jgi:hypothetical protein
VSEVAAADVASMFSSRGEIIGWWPAVMRHRRTRRGMRPAEWKTRCIRAGEIHEVILCAPGVPRGQPVDDVSYLGFTEILRGGLLALGDELHTANRLMGVVYGFDETHYPNHYNILIAAASLVTGEDIQLRAGQSVVFAPAADNRGNQHGKEHA